MDFIRINNRNNFLIKELCNYHPDSLKYLNWWKIHKKRCIEGFWGVDDKNISVDISNDFSIEKTNSWRWMPPNLYFYVNFGTILHKPKGTPKTAPKKPMRPYLRDLEWEFFYNWMECRGFSGFEDDQEFTCNTDVKKYTDGDLIESDLHPSTINNNGDIKKYIPCNKYIRELKKRPYGRPLYENEAKNLFLLGARGGGKSYLTGVGLVLHEILFDGARYYNKESIEHPYVVEVFVGAALSSKSSETLSKTKLALDYLPGTWAKGTISERPSPIYKEMSGSLKPNNMKTPWIHLYDKKTGSGWTKIGTRSKVLHGIFSTENPEAAAGTRPGIILIEEVGLLNNVLSVHGSNNACQMTDGTSKFGSSVYIGTGGSIEKIVESEVIFRDPKGYDFLEFEDIWENTGEIGWFIPAYYMDGTFKDENGNTDKDKALLHYQKRREEKKQAKNAKALDYEMMNYPLSPSEMFLSASKNRFPVHELKARLAKLLSSKSIDSSYKGHFVFKEGKVEFNALDNIKPIRDFPIERQKDIDLEGCVELFEHPRKVGSNVPSDRYIGGMDPIDDDDNNDNTRSLQSFWVFDTWERKLVLEYSARTKRVKKFYEQVRKGLLYYKCKLLYENQKKGLFGYFDYKTNLHLLADTPEFLKDMDLQKPGSGNKAKGFYATVPINNFGLTLIEEWLEEKAYHSTTDNEIINIDTIRSIGLLKELILYNGEINCDRISSLGATLIYAESLKKRTEKRKENIKTKANDEFFKRNYKISYNPMKYLPNNDVNSNKYANFVS